MTEEQHEQTKPAEDQKAKPAPQNEPNDPLGSGCGFTLGEGV